MENSNSSVQVVIPPKQSFAKEWASDQKSFKGVPWGKAMMWIFLVSDTFVFSIFFNFLHDCEIFNKSRMAKSKRSFWITCWTL